jgi:hypothetical protein
LTQELWSLTHFMVRVIEDLGNGLLQELGDRFIGWGGGEKWLIGTQKAL